MFQLIIYNIKKPTCNDFLVKMSNFLSSKWSFTCSCKSKFGHFRAVLFNWLWLCLNIVLLLIMLVNRYASVNVASLSTFNDGLVNPFIVQIRRNEELIFFVWFFSEKTHLACWVNSFKRQKNKCHFLHIFSLILCAERSFT